MINIYTYVYVRMYIYICIYIYISLCVCVCVCVQIHHKNAILRQLHHCNRDSQDLVMFLAPSADKQTNNYDTQSVQTILPFAIRN